MEPMMKVELKHCFAASSSMNSQLTNISIPTYLWEHTPSVVHCLHSKCPFTVLQGISEECSLILLLVPSQSDSSDLIHHNSNGNFSVERKFLSSFTYVFPTQGSLERNFHFLSLMCFTCKEVRTAFRNKSIPSDLESNELILGPSPLLSISSQQVKVFYKMCKTLGSLNKQDIYQFLQ